jgi:hypothetical protein
LSRARTAGPIPSRSHSASSTCVPPSGRDSVNSSSSAGRALPGSRCRETDPTSRSSASLVPGSSRPKLYTTCTRDRFAAGSHTLWASCRYRTSLPSLFRRGVDRKYTY